MAAEDGVTITAATAGTSLDPTVAKFMYHAPLGNYSAFDIQLEFYSTNSGAPWQIQGVDLEYDFDTDEDPARV